MTTKIVPNGVTGTYKRAKNRAGYRDYGTDTFAIIPYPHENMYKVSCDLVGGVDKEALVMVRDCINLVLGDKH